jgi:hypothetical protein
MPSGHQYWQIQIVDARTSMEHLVIDESVVAHRHAGRYLAVCGAQVLGLVSSRAARPARTGPR